MPKNQPPEWRKVKGRLWEQIREKENNSGESSIGTEFIVRPGPGRPDLNPAACLCVPRLDTTLYPKLPIIPQLSSVTLKARKYVSGKASVRKSVPTSLSRLPLEEGKGRSDFSFFFFNQIQVKIQPGP